MSGYYLMYRGAMDHPLFKGEVYTRFQAWEWLIGNAAWETVAVGVSGRSVRLQRGQLTYSIRYMADAWKWPKSVVDRYIGKLEISGMITTQSHLLAVNDMSLVCKKAGTHGGTGSGRGQLIITICNYEIYQSPQKPDRDDVETTSGTAAGQQRDSSGTNKKELNSDKEDSKKLSSKAKPAKKPLRYFEEDEPLDPDFYGVASEYPSLDPQDEWEKFRDRNLAKGEGTGSIKGSARTWCKNALLFAQRSNLRVIK